MNNKIVCVHPEDTTTDFLKPITDSLIKYLGDRVTYIRVRPSEEEHDIALYKMEHSDIIVFLGHGSSQGFHGANTCHEDEFSLFLNHQNLERFRGKSIFALSCNSADFFKTNAAKKGILSYLGFGDIKSEDERFNVSDNVEINNSSQRIFENILVRASIYALHFLIKSNSFACVYQRLIHSLNQQMVELVLKKPTQENRIIADMIYLIKKEIKIN